MAKWRKPKFGAFHHTPPGRRTALNKAKERVSQLLERDEIDEALLQLEQLVTDHPDDVELLMMLGTCHFAEGDPDAALTQYERAYALSKEPTILLPLGIAYLQLAMYGSALHAFTESGRRGLPLPPDMEPMLAQLRADVAAVAGSLRLPLEKTIAGLREMERSARWLDRNDYRRAVEASRSAIKVLGDWPPPHNNLALALFFDGQPAQAITESRQVLSHEPDNLMATANLVRFLAWTGERAAAEEVWCPLRTRSPLHLPADALKLAETAAILDDDESVRRFLLPLEDWQPEQLGWRPYVQMQQFLATAEANLGNPKAAKRRLRALDADASTHAKMLHDALRDRQKGFGLTPRFTYFRSVDVLLLARLEEFMELAADATNGDDPKAGKKLKEFVARFPQLVLVGEKLIWEEGAPEPGIFLLRSVGTLAAHAALRRFAGSQAGSDEDRTQALLALQISGGAQPGETFAIWHDGNWHETQLRGYTIGPRYEQPSYKANAVKLMEDGQAALHDGQWTKAITLLRKATELEPKAYEAFNNLAAALDMSGDPEASKAMLERALAIKPDYVHARVNLALKLVGQDADAAAAMLAPLEALATFTPEEFTLYHTGLAHVALARSQFEAARSYLQMALGVDPEYEPAAALLARIDMLEFSRGQGELWEQLRELTAESNARYRKRLAARLRTLTPTLADVLGIYTTDLLRAIFKAVAPAQRLTGLRKAVLQQIVRETLLDAASLQRLVAKRLSETERAALAVVVAAGGAMPQEEFRAAYGDDQDESPEWAYHPPQSVAGRLRLHGLLVETTVKKTAYLAIPADLRAPLAAVLG